MGRTSIARREPLRIPGVVRFAKYGAGFGEEWASSYEKPKEPIGHGATFGDANRMFFIVIFIPLRGANAFEAGSHHSCLPERDREIKG